jgi:hypothetical protein
MSSNSPSNLVLMAAVGHLSDPDIGFNPTYASVLLNYASANLPAVTIDYGLADYKSNNFFLGRLTMEGILAGTFKFPVQTLYTTAGKNLDQTKSMRFTGPVRLGGDFWLSGGPYKREQTPYDSESWASAVEETMIAVFNIVDSEHQNWGSEVFYAGELGFERSVLVEAGEGWLKQVHFEMTFTARIA